MPVHASAKNEYEGANVTMKTEGDRGVMMGGGAAGMRDYKGPSY